MRRFLELGNGVYVVFGDDGLVYLGAKMNNNVYADTSRRYNRLHSYKNGLMLLNDETQEYVSVTGDNSEIKYGRGYVAIETDIIANEGIYTMRNGILTGEDAIIYVVKKYGDTEIIHNLLGVLLSGRVEEQPKTEQNVTESDLFGLLYSL